MLSKTIQKALNNQIRYEFASSYLYLSMAAFCEESNLAGMAKWMRMQSDEEKSHGMKLFDYVHERISSVELGALDQPPKDFKSPLEMFNQVYAHELKVTESITKLYSLAIKENDYPTQVMLQWFITEQVEEEKTALGIIEQLKITGDSPVSLLMLDRQLGARAGGA
jgi:ferritin